MTKYELLLKALNLQSDLRSTLEDTTILISEVSKNGSGIELTDYELEKCINKFNLIKQTINNKTI